MHTSTANQQSLIPITQLEANHSSYCRALRILIRDELPLNKIKRTMCWLQLESLHRAMPTQYREPIDSYLLIKQQVETEMNRSATSTLSPAG